MTEPVNEGSHAIGYGLGVDQQQDRYVENLSHLSGTATGTVCTVKESHGGFDDAGIGISTIMTE